MLNLTRPEGSAPHDFRLSRRAVGAVFFAGYAVAALSAQAEPVHTDEAGLVIETVTLAPADGFKLPAYVARPAAAGRFPAVLVISEIFGVHDYIKDICRRLAKLGYVAMAPAFFVRAADPAPLSDMGAIMKIVAQAGDPQVMGDIAAALAALKASPHVDAGKLAVTGYCWGGGETWLACEEFADFKAGTAWYGRMTPPAGAPDDPKRYWPIQRVAHLHAPVLGLYGAKDALSQQVPAMNEALKAAGKTDTQIVVYPDAGHGFHADYRASYVEADAKDGWAKMLAHFAAHGVGPKAHA
ncbi:MAG TPA: dienelactone hydrolase family protein [Caulobacteraceae bacterium]